MQHSRSVWWLERGACSADVNLEAVWPIGLCRYGFARHLKRFSLPRFFQNCASFWVGERQSRPVHLPRISLHRFSQDCASLWVGLRKSRPVHLPRLSLHRFSQDCASLWVGLRQSSPVHLPRLSLQRFSQDYASLRKVGKRQSRPAQRPSSICLLARLGTFQSHMVLRPLL